MKKSVVLILIAAMAAMLLVGCGGGTTSSGSGSATSSGTTAGSNTATGSGSTKSFDSSKEIGVITRESGSGTRGAFIELFGIEQKDASGQKVDLTTAEAAVTNSTSVMMTTVSGDLYSIGYISLGSLNNTVKAIKIDGAEPTVDNIKSGTYKISRPFNIVTKGDLSTEAQDFVNFIMSADGQAVIEDNGYISVSDAAAYTGSVSSGKIVVAGSSSVTPVMEKLKEAYLSKNPGVEIEVQQSDSTTGVTSTIEGICDIGMASRELKDSETSQGVTPTVIAMDGIAVIVSNDNPTDNLTSDAVLKIYTGEFTKWEQAAA